MDFPDKITLNFIYYKRKLGTFIHFAYWKADPHCINGLVKADQEFCTKEGAFSLFLLLLLNNCQGCRWKWWFVRGYGLGSVFFSFFFFYTWLNLNFTDQSSPTCGPSDMHCASALATEEGNALKSQMGVAVVQTTKLKLGGLCIRNFGHALVLLKTWVF